MSVTKISAEHANSLQANYINNPGNEAGQMTKAVIFAFQELSDAIGQFENKKLLSLLGDPEYGFISYFGRYGDNEPDGRSNRNTLIVQFLKNINNEWHVLKDEIYNFGDLKPPKPLEMNK